MDYVSYLPAVRSSDYTPIHVREVLRMVREQGFHLVEGCDLLQLTIAQLDALVHGRYDA